MRAVGLLFQDVLTFMVVLEFVQEVRLAGRAHRARLPLVGKRRRRSGRLRDEASRCKVWKRGA